jgi:hypothetical protein
MIRKQVHHQSALAQANLRRYANEHRDVVDGQTLLGAQIYFSQQMSYIQMSAKRAQPNKFFSYLQVKDLA